MGIPLHTRATGLENDRMSEALPSIHASRRPPDSEVLPSIRASRRPPDSEALPSIRASRRPPDSEALPSIRATPNNHYGNKYPSKGRGTSRLASTADGTSNAQFSRRGPPPHYAQYLRMKARCYNQLPDPDTRPAPSSARSRHSPDPDTWPGPSSARSRHSGPEGLRTPEEEECDSVVVVESNMQREVEVALTPKLKSRKRKTPGTTLARSYAAHPVTLTPPC